MPDTEQQILWEKYLAGGGPEVREKLLMKYLPLVKYVAGKMMANLPSSVDYDDLVSAGVIGLIGALERFDPKMGNKFETFVLPRIRGAILDELRKLDWAPRSLRSKARKFERALQEMEKKLGRAVSDYEVIEELDMSEKEYIALVRDVNNAILVSLDGPGIDDGEQSTSMYDVVEDVLSDNPYSNIEKEEIKKLLARTIEKLPEQEKIVMALYYYEELTLREIGQVLNITESRVSQIHSKAVGTLRSLLMDELTN
ncbi:MAG: FliA/WhiG family RNA polymerase sigma factor [Calditrichaeota bacterium]|nr:MAG: FliA/WhiG family RNA polymerase sigma factor [Calditrichota bacterium]